MKNKLTLTIEKAIIDKAKMKASSQGISLSKLFEQVFEKDSPALEKTEAQLAAERLLKRLKKETPIDTLEKSDKELIRDHRNEKYG